MPKFGRTFVPMRYETGNFLLVTLFLLVLSASSLSHLGRGTIESLMMVLESKHWLSSRINVHPESFSLTNTSANTSHALVDTLTKTSEKKTNRKTKQKNNQMHRSLTRHGGPTRRGQARVKVTRWRQKIDSRSLL